MGLDCDKFTKYFVCPKCDTIYKFEDCYFERFGRTEIRKCSHIAQPNHRQVFRRKECGEALLKDLLLKDYILVIYIIYILKKFISRSEFTMNCELWRKRKVPSNFLTDIFDGRVWKDFMYIDNEPFLAAPNNYAFMLNNDWFQPFKHSIYMVVMNLPRELIFKEKMFS